MYSLRSTLFSLQLQLGKVFLISQFVTAVRFIKRFFQSPNKKHWQKITEWRDEFPNKQTFIRWTVYTHTPLSQRKQKINAFKLNPFLFQEILNAIISGLFESIVVVVRVDTYYSPVCTENLEKPQELDRVQSPYEMLCLDSENTKGLPMKNRKNCLLKNLY